MDFPYFENLLVEVGIKHMTNTTITRAISGTRQAFGYGGGYWEIRAKLARTNYSVAKEIAAFLNSLDGRVETFTIRLPQNITGNSNYTGSITVNGSGQVGKQINVNNLALNQTILKKGDFIKFANSPKIYQVASNLISDGSGEGILTLHTSLVGSSPASGEFVIHRPVEVLFTVALKEDSYYWDIDEFTRSDWEIELEEVWG